MLYVLICRSPGFGLILVAETTTGVMHAAESSTYSHATSTAARLPGGAGRGEGQSEEPILPEDIGKNTASLLIEEIVKVFSLALFWSVHAEVSKILMLQWVCTVAAIKRREGGG